MNETSAHFRTVCPSCLASLKINRNHIGQEVTCKHCSHTFRAEPSNPSAAIGSSDNRPALPTQSDPTSERVPVPCPNCHATLSVRRSYYGSQVQCKNCGDVFLFCPPALAQPERAERRSNGLTAPGSSLELKQENARMPLEPAAPRTTSSLPIGPSFKRPTFNSKPSTTGSPTSTTGSLPNGGWKSSAASD